MRSVSGCRTARRIRLSAGLPGTIAGAHVPPLIMLSRVSSRSPPIGDVGEEWQARHCLTSTGRTFFSKNSVPSLALTFAQTTNSPVQNSFMLIPVAGISQGTPRNARFRQYTPLKRAYDKGGALVRRISAVRIPFVAGRSIDR